MAYKPETNLTEEELKRDARLVIELHRFRVKLQLTELLTKVVAKGTELIDEKAKSENAKWLIEIYINSLKDDITGAVLAAAPTFGRDPLCNFIHSTGSFAVAPPGAKDPHA